MFFINPFIYAGGGDFESIATVTVGSGGASSIEFASIPSTYQLLQLRLVVRGATSDTGTELRWRAGNGSIDTGSNYSNHLLYGNGSGAFAAGYSSQAYAWLGTPTAATATASVFGAFVIDILDYASTSKNKTVRAFGGRDVNGSGVAFVSSGAWLSTSAVDVLRVYPGAGDWAQYSTAALYGVKAP
jgi:hypothetical protein